MAFILDQEKLDILKNAGWTQDQIMEAASDQGAAVPDLIAAPLQQAPAYDPELFYSDGGTISSSAIASPATLMGPVVAVTVTMLTRVLGPFIGRSAWSLLRGIVGVGTRFGAAQWARIPSWIKVGLAFLGIQEGMEFVLDGDDETALVPQASGGSLVLQDGLPAGVIGSWTANGVTFYRLVDGRLAVQNKRGRWKVWRPKKPIVIFAGGVGDLRTLLRADKAIDAQSKKLDNMLNRRTRRTTRRAACSDCGLVRGHRSGCALVVNVK